MNNRIYIIAASLFWGACGASLPAKAMASVTPPTSLMQRMPQLVKFGGYLGSGLILKSIAQTVTNPIKNYLKTIGAGKQIARENAKKKNETSQEKASYIEQGCDFATNIVTGAAFDWWALPFFFQQKKHPLNYYLVSSLTRSILEPVIEHFSGFCLSKITNTTKMRLLCSLGLAIPAMAWAMQAGERITYATTRSLTGVKEDPLFPFKFCLGFTLVRLTYSLLLSHPCILWQVSGKLDELEQLASTALVTEQTWEAIIDKVDEVSFLTDKEYASEQLASNNLLPQGVLDDYVVQRRRAYEVLRIINRKITNLSREENSAAAQALGVKLKLILDV